MSLQDIANIACALKHSNLENALGYADNDFKKLFKAMKNKRTSVIGGLKQMKTPGIDFIISSNYERDSLKRNMLLNKAVSSAIDEQKEKLSAYARSLYLPTMILFGFGSMIPLMLISLLPVLSIFKVMISPYALISILFFSLILIYFYSDIVLRKRPGLDRIKEKSKHIEVSLVLFLVISFPSIIYMLQYFGIVLLGPMESLIDSVNTLPIIIGAGISLSVFYYLNSKDAKKRFEEKDLENKFLNALEHIKSRLNQSLPFEYAIKHAYEISNLEFLSKMHSSFRFMKIENAIKKYSSGFIRNSLLLVSNAMKHGGNAGALACNTILRYAKAIKNAEQEMLSLLQKNIVMMRATAVLFAPAIGAIVIVLFKVLVKNMSTMHSDFFDFTSLMSPQILQLFIGFYVLGLSLVLTRYSAVIIHNWDDTLVRSELSRTIPLTLAVYVGLTLVLGWLV